MADAPIVSLIHAVPAAVQPVVDALGGIRPVRILNQLDEALLVLIDRYGGLTRECVDRMATQITLAQQAGSSVIVATCNAYSLAIMTRLRPAMPETPIIVIDEPMIRQALTRKRFCVIATVRAGLDSQREIVDQLAGEVPADGRPEVEYVLREDAFAALRDGEVERHDLVIIQEIERALRDKPVVVLAQASMARVTRLLEPGTRERVLVSPTIAALEVDRILQTLEPNEIETR